MFNNQEERELPQDSHGVFNVLSVQLNFSVIFMGLYYKVVSYPNFILVLVICQTCKDGSTTNPLKWKVCSSTVQKEDV